MIGVALKGLLGRKLRATLTAFAIVLGVAMISGAFVLTDTLGKTFDGIYEDSYKATDAIISSKVAVDTGNGDTEAPAFSAAVLQKVERLPGVRVAQGSIEDEIRLVDENGNAIGSEGEGVASGDGQVAIDKATATKEHFDVGQTVGAFGEGPLARYRISGIVRFGSEDSLGGTTISVFDLPTAQRLFDKRGQFDLIRVGAKDGVSEAALIRE